MRWIKDFKIYEETCEILSIKPHTYWWYLKRASCVANWLHKTLSDRIMEWDLEYVSDNDDAYINTLWIDKQAEQSAQDKYTKKKFWITKYNLWLKKQQEKIVLLLNAKKMSNIKTAEELLLNQKIEFYEKHRNICPEMVDMSIRNCILQLKQLKWVK